MAESVSGDCSNDKVLSNKRKSRDVPVDNSLALTEFPRYELLSEKIQNAPSDGCLKVQFNPYQKEEEGKELHPADWDDPMAWQLEELLAENLSSTFRCAIKKIAEGGYSEDVAEWAVLRSGLCYGSKDPVSSIVDSALVILRREKDNDSSKSHIFGGLENLVEYTMLEMIHVLREVKPSLTISEAMWFLLMCDLDLSHACEVEGDPSSGCGGKDIPRESSSTSTPSKPKSEAETTETIPSTSQTNLVSKGSFCSAQLPSEIPTANSDGQWHSLISEQNPKGIHLSRLGELLQSILASEDEKSASSRKGCLPNSKRDMLRQKSFHVEKNYKGHVSKGSLRAKFAARSSVLLDKKVKSSTDYSCANMKNISSKSNPAVGVNVPVAEGSHHLSSTSSTKSAIVATDSPALLPSKDIVSPLPVVNAKLHASLPVGKKPVGKKPTPEKQASSPASPKTLDYFAGIPYDKSTGKHVPQDDKDNAILLLVPQLQKMQKEIQGWTDWANQKVMQAARRLSKDQAELKTLRQEKEETERFTKGTQFLEENTVKRLSEMENALANASGQVAGANETICRLEEENSVLKKEMETARLQALESAANLHEAYLREQEASKTAQPWDTEKFLLQEDFLADKHKVSELQHLVQKARGFYNQLEARHKQEEKEKESLLTEAKSIRKRREQLESLAREEEDMIRQKADNGMQKYKEGIKKLESKISELRLVSETSKIAALKRGLNGSYGSHPTEGKDATAFQRYQSPKVTKRLPVFQGDFGNRRARVERECVMCMTEEMSVVFLPCAHQVLCVNCNERHEKQGMNDCPSCRTPIKRRINVHFASP